VRIAEFYGCYELADLAVPIARFLNQDPLSSQA
jgi:hypothetical protein